MFRSAEFRNAIIREVGITNNDDTIYVLGMEVGTPNNSLSIEEIVLDALVKTLQPAPVLTHVELFIPPGSGSNYVTFATYLGRSAGWGESFPGSRDFYLGGKHSWRAIPVRASNIVPMALMACKEEEGAPYSVLRYLTSVPPARSLASFLPDSPKSPGHCATISARVLGKAGVHLPRSSAWYSPSTLYIELSKPRRMKGYSQHSIVETEDTMEAVETLLRGSDDAVKAMSYDACHMAIDHLQKKVVEQHASELLDTEKEVAMERNLAKALLRWGELKKNATD